MQKKSVVKRIVTTFLVTMLIGSMFSLSVSAAETSDKPWAFNFHNIGNKDQYTASRQKTNTTNIYFYCQSAQQSFVVYAEGSANGSSGWQDRSQSPNGGARYTYTIQTGSKRGLRNWIKDGSPSLGYARVHGYRDYWQGFKANGQWSPDSVPFTEVS